MARSITDEDAEVIATVVAAKILASIASRLSPIEPTALYTVPQAARLLSLHPVTLRKKLRCGLIPGKRRVGQWRLRGSELLNLMR